jgi:Ribbon-helix-helix protein, copG family
MTETGLVRKTIWLHEDEAEALRRHAYEERRSESELVREAVRRFFAIPD